MHSNLCEILKRAHYIALIDACAQNTDQSKNDAIQRRMTDDGVISSIMYVSMLCSTQLNVLIIPLKHKSLLIFNNLCTLNLCHPTNRVKLIDDKDTVGSDPVTVLTNLRILPHREDSDHQISFFIKSYFKFV